jgi:perosamine synthetase
MMIPVAEPSITEKEIAYVLDAVKSGWVSSAGSYVQDFEKRFAEYMGTQYALSVSNGTTALHLSLLSLEIGPEDEVIVPDLTFVATANAVVYTGAKPVFADIDPETWCIDPYSVKQKLTSNTKAIIPVHLYGHPAPMDEIIALAAEFDLAIIEDAAEAHGAEYKGKKVGSLGDVGIFSMYGNKIITTGEGGMLTTNSEEIYEKAKLLRDHGMSRDHKYWHTMLGYNYRLTNLQAALGLAQLERIEELIHRRGQILDWYTSCLDHVKQLRLNPQTRWARNVVWMVCLLCDGPDSSLRDHLMQELRKQGIDSRPFFYPVSAQPFYGNRCINPITTSISQRGLNLPSSPSLPRKIIESICQIILEAVDNYSCKLTPPQAIRI